ncbi:MAG TPA: polysaccharide deacetylase family protein [Candidatus Methylacidiphilales bacterium]|nr:polysaccharide deacetylase family protein [Candidatus Methylacidiphilales bacterium]
MFLKRTLVLIVGVLVFIAGFILYFMQKDSIMEQKFRHERQAHNADGMVLTTQIASNAVPAPSSPPPPLPALAQTPASASDTVDTAAPSATAAPSPPPLPSPVDVDTNSAPMAPNSVPEAPDTNVIIGPLPPSNSPDNAPASSNSAPSGTNSSNPPASSSTMLYPGIKNLALVMLAAYTPFPAGGAQVQAMPSVPPAITAPAPVAPAPATNTPAPTTAPSTNAAPVVAATNTVAPGAQSGMARPMAVEASVIVLGYHQFVGPGQSSKNPYVMRQDVFDSEMKYLKDNGYHVVPLSDVVRFVKHEIGLPPNSVAITIDDGYKSAIVWAAPVLKKYGFPWTFFVYPDFITTTESKGAASWPDLLALQKDGVDIECHSMTHPILTSHHQRIKGVWHNFSPEEYDQWLTNETAGAKALIEKKMGKPVPYFAYPYGAYNKEVQAKVIAAGFDAIFTVADNPVHSTTDKFSMGRYIITQPVERSFTAYLRQGALGLADANPMPGATTSDPRPVITAVLGYAGTLNPKSIETEVRDFGLVRHDFDPKTSTVRLYLPRDLIDPVVVVNIRVRDAETGQVMVANWHFNYVPASAPKVHPPIGAASTTNSPTATAGTPSIPATAKNTPALSANVSSATTPAATNASPALSPSSSATVPVPHQADPPK